jgi:hypothetical protein
VGLFHCAALAQPPSPSKRSDPVELLQTTCLDHKADFDAVLSFAKSTGWLPASDGGFPMPGAFQETASLQSSDTDEHEGVLLYAGRAVFPHQGSSNVCIIGLRPGNYEDVKSKLEKWMGSAPSKEDAMGATYVYQEISGVRRALPATTDQASRDAVFKNGPVLGIAIGHLSNMTMLLYSVTSGPR